MGSIDQGGKETNSVRERSLELPLSDERFIIRQGEREGGRGTAGLLQRRWTQLTVQRSWASMKRKETRNGIRWKICVGGGRSSHASTKKGWGST